MYNNIHRLLISSIHKLDLHSIFKGSWVRLIKFSLLCSLSSVDRFAAAET